MKCQQCGTELNNGVLFCRNCGCKIVQPPKKLCGKCGAPYEDGAKFCERCGTNLSHYSVNSSFSSISNSSDCSTPSSGYKAFNMNSASDNSSNYRSYSDINTGNNTFNSSNSVKQTTNKSATSLTGNPQVDRVYETVKDTTDQFVDTAKGLYDSVIGGLGLNRNNNNTDHTENTYKASSTSDQFENSRSQNSDSSSYTKNHNADSNINVTEEIFNTIKKGTQIRNQTKKKETNISGILALLFILIALMLFIGTMSKRQSSGSSSNSGSASSNISTDISIPQDRPLRNGFDEKTTKKYRFGNYFFSIPSYWKVETDQNDVFRAFAETDGKLAMLLVDYSRDEVDPVTPEMFHNKDELDEIARIISESWFNECSSISYKRHDIPAAEGYIYAAAFTLDGYPGIAEIYTFPSYEDNRYFTVVLMQTYNTDYDYSEDYLSILNTIKKVSNDALIIDSPYYSYTDNSIYSQENTSESTDDQQDNNVTQLDEATVEVPYETDFDYAYKREYASNYYGYYLIDIDDKKVVYFESSCPEYPYYGSYSGDTSTQIKINFPNDGYYVTMTFPSGIGGGASVVIQDDTLRSPFDCVPVEDIAKKVEKYLT